MKSRAKKYKPTRNIGTGLTALFLVLCVTGCTNVRSLREPQLEALAGKLDHIETVQLKEQSKSAPTSIEQATEQAAKSASEPNVVQPMLSLTLEEVRAAALANNLDLKVELINPSIAQQSVDAERAKFESVFFGSANYARAKPADGDEFSFRSYEAGVEVPLQTGGSVTASVPVEDVGGVSDAAVSVSYIQSLLRGAGTRVNMYSIRVAMYQKGLVDTGTKLSAIRTLAGADTAYWELYSARKQLDVLREQYKLAQNQLKHARSKVNAGSAPRIEIVRAESGLAGRLEAVISAETEVRNAERELKRIMNRKDLPLDSPTGLIAMTEPDPKGLDLDPEALVKAAMDNRMEMAQLEMRSAVDEINVQVARNNTLPQLTLNYAYTAGRQSGSIDGDFGDVSDELSQDHSIGLNAVVPLGNQAAKARLRQARLEKIQTEADRQRWQQIIRQDVYQALDSLEQNWRHILAAEQGVGMAYRNYRVEQLQFQLGQRTSTDVLIAAENLAGAQLRKINAFAGYEIAQVRLAQATGTLLGRGNIQLPATATEGS